MGIGHPTAPPLSACCSLLITLIVLLLLLSLIQPARDIERGREESQQVKVGHRWRETALLVENWLECPVKVPMRAAVRQQQGRQILRATQHSWAGSVPAKLQYPQHRSCCFRAQRTPSSASTCTQLLPAKHFRLGTAHAQPPPHPPQSPQDSPPHPH